MTASLPVPLLDVAILNGYEERLRFLGIPLDEWTNPGLKRDEMEEVLAPLDVRLPVEGLVLWGWHNGATRKGREKLFGPGRECLSLGEAIAVYHQLRTIAEQTTGAWPQNDPDFLWNSAWIPITGPQHPLVIDCSVAADEPTPIRVIDWQNVDGFFKPRAESLGQMVSWWIEAIDCGAWRWDPERNQWNTHDELLERELRTNPLV
jgi:hypothetical protein